jgi:elongation factor G
MKSYVWDESDPLGVKFNTSDPSGEQLVEAKKWRESLIEAVCDFDDVLAEKFLGGAEISEDELIVGIRKATLSLNFVGVIPGSAFKKKAVQPLLDCVVDFLPCPLDIPPANAQDSDGAALTVESSDKSKVVSLAFKIWTDPFVGKLVFLRVYAGELRKGMTLLNSRTRRTERVSRLILMKANTREEIEVAYAGDICAIVGIKGVVTGDTLSDEDADIRLEPPTFPEPVISMSIEPRSKADQEKMGVALSRLAEEDPTFRVSSNAETSQTIIAGMGELHLEIIRDRLFREHKVEADAGKPQIAYRETILSKADGEGKFIRQSGGKGQYGHACIKLEPNERGKGIEVINETVGGSIPKEYIKPTMEGIKEAANNGTVAGYPVVDWIARIYDGSFHEVDSSEMAFKMAGIFAFKDAMKQAQPILELGIQVRSCTHFRRLEHRYPDMHVVIDFFLVKKWSGVPVGRDDQELAWIAAAELGEKSLLPADAPLVADLQRYVTQR